MNAPRSGFLDERLRDGRGQKVLFVSHCLLNQNTRYLGGATRAGAVEEFVRGCLASGYGIVQMPCPEQCAWGGVRKTRLIRAFGVQKSWAYRLQRAFLPLFLLYTRWVYRGLARTVVREIADYERSGYEVIGFVGVDNSPSCGVEATLDVRVAFEQLAMVDPLTVTPAAMRAIVRETSVPGEGLYVVAVVKELRRRGLKVPLFAHDLLAELNGIASGLPPGLPKTEQPRQA